MSPANDNCLHSLASEQPWPERFTYPFCYEPHPLAVEASRLLQRHIAETPSLLAEANGGKMFGVLVVATTENRLGWLAAYSGQMKQADAFFVPPAFDYMGNAEFVRAMDETATRADHSARSEELQRWLFDHFFVLNARGEQRNLSDIFSSTPQRVPPSGAGECCAPKLLQHAFACHYRPLCMAEFWWGESPRGEIRHHLNYYPSCQGKCKPILNFMLEGICVDPNPLADAEGRDVEIVYEDEALLFVSKPAGMLSVPGRVERESAESLLSRRYPFVKMAHRLDMATSGLLVAAKTPEVHRALQQQFEHHEVRKRYVALLDGVPEKSEGTVRLPLMPDFINRPCQRVDYENGKLAITSYRVVAVEQGRARVLLYPKTGRTHQLRVHCAHRDGLGCPIVGDALYGTAATRLYLHAEWMEIVHPLSQKIIRVERKADF